MKTLQINEKDARRLYKTASAEFKQVLEDTFGKEFFTGSVLDRVNTYEDALAATGQPDVTNFGDVPTKYVPFFRAMWRNVMIVEALNDGEQMDIYDSDKRRYYPYFACNNGPSGFAFYDSYFGSSDADAGSGSRLSLKDLDRAVHYGKKFTGEIRDMLTK